MSFRNWSMIWKIVSLLLILGGVSLSGGIYSAQQMRSIDQTYSSLIDGPSVATLEGAGANRGIVSAVAAIYQHVVSPDDASNKVAVEVEAAAIKIVDDKIASAGKLYPKFSEKLGEALKAFHVAYDTTCAVTRKMADSTDPDGMAKAADMML